MVPILYVFERASLEHTSIGYPNEKVAIVFQEASVARIPSFNIDVGLHCVGG
jgi:hypothetical protein